MSDQTTPAPGANGETAAPPAAQTTPETNPQELTNSLNASRRREAEAKKALDDATARLAALEKAEQERKQAEMSELEQAQAALVDKEKAIEDLTTYKTRWTEHETAEAEKVTAAMEGLSDEQKVIVDALPLDKRLALISQYKGASETPKPGVTHQTGTNSSDGRHFSEEQVRKMTPDEIRKNMKAIDNSRKNW